MKKAKKNPAAVALGKISTPKKAQTSAQNAAKARAALAKKRAAQD